MKLKHIVWLLLFAVQSVHCVFFCVESEARDEMVPVLDDIKYTLKERREVVGTLNPEKMKKVIDNIYSYGKAEIDKGNIEIGTEKLSVIESIFVTLWQPNWVLNTEGDYERYDDDLTLGSYICSWDEFSKATLDKGREAYSQLIEYFEKKGGNKGKLLKHTGIGSII